MLQITINGSDISSHIVSFTREKDLCSSEGIVEFVLDSYATINPYAVIRVYENTILKGTFYTDFTEKMSDGTMTVHGRDNSKRAQDYYIAERFFAEGDTTSRYWIEFFLGMAGISYNFTTADTGYIIQDGEMMGLTSCAEVVEMLVRYSGWYIYYDASNVAQIGKLNYDSSNYKASFDDEDIITIVHLKSDQYLRNRAVVWGAGYTGSQEWVFADITVNTPWNYDSQDVRAILARAGFPVPFSQAIATANVLLNEYARLVEEKTITVHGYHNLEIGDFVLIQSQYYNGLCLISAINTSAEDGGGYTTTLILDRRCPRFVGFYDVGGIVYAGTEEDGIWTKPLKGPHTWSDYSAGLYDLNIHDLDVSYGVMSTVTATGYLYGRTVGDTAWIRLQPSYYYDTIGSGYYPASSGVYVASTVSDLDQSLYGLYTISGENAKTWITKYPAIGVAPTNIFVTLSGETKYEGVDIEVNYEDLYVSVKEISGEAISAPFYPTPKDQGIYFINGGELDDQVLTTSSMYTYFGITGNFIYRSSYATDMIKRINFRTHEEVEIASPSETRLYFIPKNTEQGYLFTFNSSSGWIKAYKILWEEETIELVSTFVYSTGDYQGQFGIFGSIRDNGVNKGIFGIERWSTGTERVGFVVFNCDTEEFSFTYYAFSDGDSADRYYFEDDLDGRAPNDFADLGDGRFAVYMYRYNGQTDYLFIVDTNDFNNSITVKFPEIYADVSNNEVLLAPNKLTGDLYVQLIDNNNYILKLYKITPEGTKTDVKTFDYGPYIPVFQNGTNYALAYNNNKVVSVHSDGVRTYYLDCATGYDLGDSWFIYGDVFSQNLDNQGDLYAFCGAEGSIDLTRYSLFQSKYDYYLVDSVEDWGTGGTDASLNKNTLTISGELITTLSDYEEDEEIFYESIPVDSNTHPVFLDILEGYGLFKFSSYGVFRVNAPLDIYSTCYTFITIDDIDVLGSYSGKAGTEAGIQSMYDDTLSYTTSMGLGYPSATFYGPSSDGHHADLYYILDPNDYLDANDELLENTIRLTIGDRLNGFWGYRNDNDGELFVKIHRMALNRSGDVSIKFVLDSPIVAYDEYDYAIFIEFKWDPSVTDEDYRQFFIKINGTKYYGFEENLYSSTSRGASRQIDLPNGFSIADLEAGYTLFPKAGKIGFFIDDLNVPDGRRTTKAIDKVSTAGYRTLFKETAYTLPTQYTIPFLRAIGKFISYPRGGSPLSNPILHTYDNNFSGNIGRILRYRDGEFENVFGLTGASFNLDISNSAVITAYTGVSTSGTIFISGEEHSTGSSRGDIYFSFAGDYGHFRHINLPTMSGSYIYDTRGFTIVDISGEYRNCIGMVVLSGLYGSVGQFSYIDVTEYSDIGGVITFPDIYTVESFDYVPVALETSNYNHYNTPYFLVGLSGTYTPFLQRDIDTEDFINRSDNFPTSRITTIRLDDMI